jgi:hypothetical protein
MGQAWHDCLGVDGAELITAEQIRQALLNKKVAEGRELLERCAALRALPLADRARRLGEVSELRREFQGVLREIGGLIPALPAQGIRDLQAIQ